MQDLLKKYYKIFLLFVLFLYFSTNLLYGDRGYISLQSLEKQEIILEDKYAALRAKREKLENNVKLLRSNSVNKDMLDEQARKQLGYVKSNEIIILNNK